MNGWLCARTLRGIQICTAFGAKPLAVRLAKPVGRSIQNEQIEHHPVKIEDLSRERIAIQLFRFFLGGFDKAFREINAEFLMEFFIAFRAVHKQLGAEHTTHVETFAVIGIGDIKDERH